MRLVGPVVPAGHFSWQEAECHSDPPVPVPAEYHGNVKAVVRELERIRRVCGNKPLAVTRIYSTAAHNASVGGAKASQHLSANAADVTPPGKMTTAELASVIHMLACEPESRIKFIKHYPGSHVHFDLRPGKVVIVEGV